MSEDEQQRTPEGERPDPPLNAEGEATTSEQQTGDAREPQTQEPQTTQAPAPDAE